MHTETFMTFELGFFEQLRKIGYSPATIYDIGASNGNWSKGINQIFPNTKYHLFEPLTGRCSKYEAQLRETLSSNPNLTMHPIALGNATGSVPMFVSPDGYSSSLLEFSVPELVKMDVPCWRLEEFVKSQGLPKPNVIKIDVQGFEAFILEGAGDLVGHADILLLETWLERGYGPNTVLLTELVEALRPLDFVLVDLGGPYFGDMGRLICVDAFFLSKRLIETLKALPTGAAVNIK